jgi:type IV pilus assembly protein PilA
MLQRLRNRARGQEGFTLIELLVVILIIGILAAVAIPTFLSQTGKAYDSNVESSLNSAQTAMETYYTSNEAYPPSIRAGTVTNNPLISIEPTLTTAFTNGTASGDDDMSMTLDTATEYTLVGEDIKSTPKIWFDLTYNKATGAETRTCQTSGTASTAATGAAALDNKGACSATATWGG